MDETNPVFENFRNKMRAFGQPIRGTTRRVSASKFLGKDDLENKIEINARKITILKNIIQAQQIATGEMIKSLTEKSPVRTIENDIIDIKKTLSSIVETLEAQEKFEVETFRKLRLQQENEKRRKRENLLEKSSRKLTSFVQSVTDRVVAPVKNFFMRIVQFFVTLFFGRFIVKFLQFLSNPKNINIVIGIADFIENNFNLILLALGAGVTALGIFSAKLLGISGILRLATGLNIGGGILGRGLGMRGMAMQRAGVRGKAGVTANLSGMPLGSRFGNTPKIKYYNTFMFNKGGLVPGAGNQDTVPAMLTPGEVVISKPAVEKYGASNLLRLNENVGKKNKPRINNNRFYFNEAGQVPSGFGDLFNIVSGIQNKMMGLENSPVGTELKNFNPIKLKETAEKFKLNKSETKSIPIDIMSIVSDRLGKNLDTSKIEKTFEKFNEIDPTIIMGGLNSVIENSPIKDSGDIKNLFNRIKPVTDPIIPSDYPDEDDTTTNVDVSKVGDNINLFTAGANSGAENNDIIEGDLAQPDPKVLAVLGLG